MKVPFDIKYRPQIESGEYKVITAKEQPVRIICWDRSTTYWKIVALVLAPDGETENPFTYDVNGKESKGCLHNHELDLYVIVPLPDNIFKQAVDTFGADHQIGLLREEVSELLAAINQYARCRVGKDAVVTEIADVMIMCEQMAEIFGREETEAEKRRKIERLAGELEKSLSL